MGKFSGRKFGRHSTAIPAAKSVVKAANRDSRVTKVSLGFIKTAPNAPKRIKFNSINGGWKITVRGTNSIQELWVYTPATKVVKKALQSAFAKGK